MLINDVIFKTNTKVFVTVHPKNKLELDFSDHLWIPSIYQPRAYFVLIVIVTFH